MLLFMKALRMLGRQYFRPRYANLAFPIKSADARLLEERLGCRVNGKASANAIAFPVDALDSPVPTSDRVLFSMLGSCMPQLRVEIGRASWRERGWQSVEGQGGAVSLKKKKNKKT